MAIEIPNYSYIQVGSATAAGAQPLADAAQKAAASEDNLFRQAVKAEMQVISDAPAVSDAPKISATPEITDTASTPKSYDLDAIFQKAADTYNVPVSLLKAMAKAESNFNIYSVSSCGAQGIMQLMPATQKALGVTDPFDPEQNIMGGAKYIAGKIAQYDGNITLALAAYQAGSGNVKKYGGVPPFKSTQTYIKNIQNYMRSDMTAGTVAASTKQRSSALSSADTASALVSSIAKADSSNKTEELLTQLSQLLGNSNNGDNLINVYSKLFSNATDALSETASEAATMAKLLTGDTGLQALYSDAASSGMLSQWLAMESLDNDDTFGGFSDLIRAYNSYNMLRINAGISAEDRNDDHRNGRR